MIGELFNAMMDEAFGDADPATRRCAALPYLCSKYNAYTQGVGSTLSAMSAAPAMAPPPPAFTM